MKHFLLFFFPILLLAKTYTFSGASENVVQIIASEILKKAYERADIDIKVIFLPAEASLQASNSGSIDGELARIEKISKLYKNLVQVPISLVSVEAVAFSKNDSIKIDSWEDLKGHDFTIIKGTKFIETATKDYDKSYTDTFVEAFEALRNDETDIIVIPKKAAIRLCLKAESCQMKAISPVLQRLELYHFVHKKNIHLIPIIQPILQNMKDSGEIGYIRFSYLKSLTN